MRINQLFVKNGRVKVGWRLTLFFLLITVFSIIVTFVWKILKLPPQQSFGVIQTTSYVITGVILFLVVVLSIYITMRLTETRKFNTIGLNSNNLRNKIIIGACFGLITPLIICFVFSLSGNAIIRGNDVSISIVFKQLLPFLIFFIFQAGFEELIFRGYGLQLFIEGLGKNAALVITGLLFGLVHTSNPTANIGGLLNTSLNGILLAVVVVKTGSVILAWAYHASWNIFSGLVMGLNVSGNEFKNSIFSIKINGPQFITGGQYGFEGSLFTGITETIILLVLIYLLNLFPLQGNEQNYFQFKAVQKDN